MISLRTLLDGLFVARDRLSVGRRVGLILGLLLVSLFALIAKAETRLVGGSPVILATVPVDPRSLMQGDYVTLRYEISSLPASLFSGEQGMLSVQEGRSVYVVLKQEENGPVWHPVRASFSRPSVTPPEKMIVGAVVRSGPPPFEARYGIEGFFVPENQGNWVERLPRSKVTIRLILQDNGMNAMDALLVDGEPAFPLAGLLRHE